MKNWFLILLTTSLASIGYSQCPTGINVRLVSQAEIDNFPLLYPSCTDFDVSFRIGPESRDVQPDTETDITNLLGLSSIHSAKSFSIQNTTYLQNLEGLENLRKVSGLFINNNESLADLSHLEGLDTSYLFYLESSPLVTNIDIIHNMSNLSQFKLTDHHAIKAISDIPPIPDLVFLNISNCDSLANFEGIEEYNKLFGVTLRNNNRLSNLSGINNLPNLDRIELNGLDSLKNLNDLIGIDTLLFFRVQSIPQITTLVGLDSLRSVWGFTISDNQALESLEGISNYNSIYPGQFDFSTNELEPGQLSISSNPSLIDLSGLDSLAAISQIVIQNNDRLKNLMGLENLEVHHSLEVSDNDSLTTLEGYTLNFNDNSIIYEDCEGYYFENYISISNNSTLESLELFSNKSYLNSNLNISNNNKLTNLYGLHNLRTVIGNLHIAGNSNLENLSALSNLEYFFKLTITGNAKLTNLMGLSDVRLNIDASLEISENVSLISLNGLKKPTEVSSLELIDNDNLVDIIALEDLTTIYKLSIEDNDMLQNLDALSNITSSIHNLNIVGNDALNDISSLNGVQSIDAFDCVGNFALGELTIESNPLLSECEIMPICDALVSQEVVVDIENNGIGCNSPEDLNCDGVSISGFVFYDANQNGILDVGENGVSNIPINFDPPNRAYLTKSGGKYFQVCQEGIEYNISFPDLDNYSLTTTNDYNIVFQQGNNINYDNNFGIYPNTIGHNIKSNVSSNSTLCNREIDFFLSLENIGTIVENGNLRIDYDPLSSYSWSSPMADSINTESSFLLWDISDLTPFGFEKFDIRFDMPDETFTGEILDFTSSFIVDSMGTDIVLNEYTYSPTVLCSYDPNDKLVMPVGMYDENYTLKGEKLTYTVRFQNTGNASAIDVTVIDTISNLLDLKTFRVVNSSFTPQTIIDDREVTFLFKDINLIDSLSDERNSHGFVTFEIDPTEGIEDYSEIENKADIIFDFNAPIITNTVRNTMVTTFPTSIVDPSVINYYSVFPNPITPNEVLNVDYDLENSALETEIVLFNYLGQEISSKDGNNGRNQLDIRSLQAGIYFIGLRHNDHVFKASKVVITN